MLTCMESVNDQFYWNTSEKKPPEPLHLHVVMYVKVPYNTVTILWRYVLSYKLSVNYLYQAKRRYVCDYYVYDSHCVVNMACTDIYIDCSVDTWVCGKSSKQDASGRVALSWLWKEPWSPN